MRRAMKLPAARVDLHAGAGSVNGGRHRRQGGCGRRCGCATVLAARRVTGPSPSKGVSSMANRNVLIGLTLAAAAGFAAAYVPGLAARAQGKPAAGAAAPAAKPTCKLHG